MKNLEQTIKYKTITTASHSRFDDDLNRAIKEGWSIVGNISTCYNHNTVQISILLSKFIEDEENRA